MRALLAHSRQHAAATTKSLLRTHASLQQPCNRVWSSQVRAEHMTPFVSSERRHPTWSLQDYSSPSSSSDGDAVAAATASPSDPITASELSHLCHLSYLSPPEGAELQRTLGELEAVVQWIGTITPLRVQTHQPMYSPLEIAAYYDAIENITTADPRTCSSNPTPTAATPSPAGSSSSPAEPTDADAVSLADAAVPESLRLRADVVTDGGVERNLLAHAPYKHRGFYVVPKVVDLEDS